MVEKLVQTEINFCLAHRIVRGVLNGAGFIRYVKLFMVSRIIKIWFITL